ncbi:hypothetical protein XENTR_v10004478 [Xenopus tropicalis]|nr:hypothetical protein XENTR_v10004478 [Xenopus tropicalis]
MYSSSFLAVTDAYTIFMPLPQDGTAQKIEDWRARLEGQGITVIVGSHNSPQPKGVGYAKNRAILQSSGRYLCFLDSDDVMMPQRIRMQYEAALQRPQSVSKFSIRNGLNRFTDPKKKTLIRVLLAIKP